MQICRTGRSGMVSLCITCVAFVWSQPAQAQVKLEHKYIEGQKLTYKTTFQDAPDFDVDGDGDRKQ